MWVQSWSTAKLGDKKEGQASGGDAREMRVGKKIMYKGDKNGKEWKPAFQ